jgi:hypothetical protein
MCQQGLLYLMNYDEALVMLLFMKLQMLWLGSYLNVLS